MAEYSLRLVSAAALVLLIGAGSSAIAQQRRGHYPGRGPVVVARQAPPVVVTGYPYYSFRPRVHISAGLFVGFPVPYPAFGYYRRPHPVPAYGYPYPAYPAYGYAAYPPYPYPYPAYQYSPIPYQQSTYVVPSPSPSSFALRPGPMNAGGASFEITPDTAEVLVDGNAMGPASQFSPMTAPLSLTPGRHRFEVRAPGYGRMAFEADIVAGEVTPFQITIEP